MTKQEENWELMTMLRMPWEDANRIDDSEDRAFLLGKCAQIKEFHEAAARAEAGAQEQAESGIITPSAASNIITP